MQVNNIQYTPNIKYTNKQKPIFRTQYDTVSFGNKIDLLDLPKEVIIKRLTKVLQNHNNFLGIGSEAVVYNIPGTKYCLRIPYLDTEGYELSKWQSYCSKSLTESEGLNHVVAKLGQGATIMNKIEGEPISFINKDHLCILDFPSKSFGTLIKQILKAKENNLVFDCSCANIIINKENKTITAIDFNEPYRKRDLQFNILGGIHLTLSMNFNEKENIKCAHKILTAVVNGLGKDIGANQVKCSDFLSYIQGIFPNMDKNIVQKLITKFEDIEILDYSIKRGINHKEKFNKLVDEVRTILKENDLLKKEAV